MGRGGQARAFRLYDGLVQRFGKERADRIATYNRNLFIFPNLVINDIMAVTVRTYYPAAPDFMNISAWALAPKEETGWARKYRLFNFLEFLGPGGFATPDDVEALEQCQRGFRNSAEAQWNDISKGMGKANPSYDDELQMRVLVELERACFQGVGMSEGVTAMQAIARTDVEDFLFAEAELLE